MITVWLLAIASCKLRDESGTEKSMVAADDGFASRAVGRDEDIPPLGRSNFDQYINARGGVQFPFEDLVSGIEGLAGTLIPFGRSLQRGFTDFKSPRVVLSGLLPSTPGCNIRGFNRIFLGYAERSESIEVISYNEQFGRFEFQIIKDYASGKNPKVFYAKRSLCISCHQNQAGIFAVNPWRESLNVAHNRIRISAAIPEGQNFFHGVSVDSPAEMIIKIDNDVRTANDIQTMQNLWINGCGTDERDMIECRRLVLEFALDDAINRRQPAFEDPKYKRLRELWNKHWPPAGILRHEHRLPDRDPSNNDLIADALDPLTSRPAIAVVAASNAKPRDMAIRRLGDEATSPKILIELISDHLFHDEAGIKIGYLKFLKDEGFSTIDSVLGSEEMAAQLQATAIQPAQIFRSILARQQPKFPKACLRGPEFVQRPALESAPALVQNLDEEKDSVIKLFRSYCARCHSDTGDERLDFMSENASPKALWDTLTSNSAIASKLAQRTMPPANSPEGKRLRQPVQGEADRTRMLIGINANL